MDIDIASINHLTKDYILKHTDMWYKMSEKYEFLDKTVDFEESVEFTKELISKEINNFNKIKSLKISLM